MSQYICSWRRVAAVSTIALLAGCAQTPALVASNPPQVPPGPNATWYHIDFTTASHTIDAQGELTVADVTNFLQQHPDTVATIIGKTDTVGSANYNMHLSHQRADAVRDALVVFTATLRLIGSRHVGPARRGFMSPPPAMSGRAEPGRRYCHPLNFTVAALDRGSDGEDMIMKSGRFSRFY